MSGPLWDRIDLHVEVPPVSFEDWSGNGRPAEESSAPVRGRVVAAHGIQGRRFTGTGIFLNAQMGPKDIRRICRIKEPERDFLEAAMDRLVLSARSLDRILKVSRTIADLAGDAEITKAHLMEAVQYRTLDREVTI